MKSEAATFDNSSATPKMGLLRRNKERNQQPKASQIKEALPKRTSLTIHESSLLSSLNKSSFNVQGHCKSSLQSSLTDDEAGVLHAINKARRRLDSQGSLGKLSSDGSTGDDSDDEEPEFEFLPHRSERGARNALRKSIAQHKSRLSVAEIEFLQCVVESGATSEEALKNANNVLLYDMSSGQEEVEVVQKEEKKVDLTDSVFVAKTENFQRRKSSMMARSFRVEMHTELLCALEQQEEEFQLVDIQDHHMELASDLDVNPFLMFTFSRPSLSSLSSLMKEEGSLRTKKGSDRATITSIPEDEETFVPSTTCGKIGFHILGTSILHEDIKQSVLSPPLMHTIRPHMPFIVREDNYWLKYSLVRDGASIEALLDKVKYSDRVLLAIETVDGEVFGSFTSSPFHVQGDRFYGTGEAFLWRLCQPRTSPCRTVEERVMLESDVESFQWSRQNMNIQLSKLDKIAIGGGVPEDPDSGEKIEGDDDVWTFGLILNSDLSMGTSGRCATFSSPCLSNVRGGEGSFEIVNVEAWTMTPMDSIEEAERLEMARHYVFDTANLVKFP